MSCPNFLQAHKYRRLIWIFWIDYLKYCYNRWCQMGWWNIYLGDHVNFKIPFYLWYAAPNIDKYNTLHLKQFRNAAAVSLTLHLKFAGLHRYNDNNPWLPLANHAVPYTASSPYSQQPVNTSLGISSSSYWFRDDKAYHRANFASGHEIAASLIEDWFQHVHIFIP